MSRKFYQKEWFEIKFDSFAKMQKNQLAKSGFYQSFYEKFFEKYSNYNDLSSKWLEIKTEIANVIASFANNGKKVLSIGCGSGYVESILVSRGIDISIIETSATPLQWISKYISSAKKFVGFFPEILPENKKYDLIYINAVDYVFNDLELIGFLNKMKNSGHLESGGRLFIFSASYYEPVPFNIIDKCKTIIKSIIFFLGLKHPGQFWGYMRTRQDYLKMAASAGWEDIQDGFTKKYNQYYLSGK
jgi:hypothetical protein